MKKTNRLSLYLALIAGILCFGNFAYKYFYKNQVDYFILLAGVFITAVGISILARKPIE